ncbi:hypothetical protein A1019T_02484 [Psychrobacter pasteurii]|uniref:Phospholipase D-like domain-containing protein n=1 Tax=Psychrobacter pasteurii TaxID=1945520 RepID=A0A1R4EIX6_9GAMM|nr:phospholipase D-like domain-containing protein [Psychrobacter pasteurii]SJM38487.1 hypothetical protein A1019T_02484 [Psychrobacter pasteurii]
MSKKVNNRKKKANEKAKSIKYTVAVPFLSNSYLFSISKKIGWSIVDYLFLKELYHQERTLSELSKKSNLRKQIILQIVLPMSDLGWVEIINFNHEFLLKITDNGKSAYLASRKNHELPCQVTDYISKREIYVDILDNYYNFYKSSVQTIAYVRYKEIKSNEKQEFVELPLLNDKVYPDYEKIEKVAGNQNESISKIEDLNIGQLTDKKYLLVEMIYTPENKSKIIKDSLYSDLNNSLIKIIESTRPPSISDSKSTQVVMPEVEKNVPSTTSITLNRNQVDFIYGGQETEIKFLELINTAQNYLIIHSTFIGSWCIKRKNSEDEQYSEYFEAIREALKREVAVYILWGKTSLDSDDDDYEKSHAEDNKVKNLLSEFNDSCRREGIMGIVDYNQFRRTESHAKFIIADSANRGACVMVSSCNFLYSRFNRFEASVAIYDDQLVRSYLRIAANISMGNNYVNSSTKKEINSYANQYKCFTKRNSPQEVRNLQEDKFTVSLVLKNQHYYYIDVACNEATKIIYITSDFINSTPERPIYDALKNSTAKKFLFYSKRSDHISHEEINETMKSLDGLEEPIKLRQSPHKPKHHAKVLAWDDNDILITSLNWLSSNASENQDDKYHEIGVHINGPNVVAEFINKFKP